MPVDPLADKYPGWSPYNYTLNNPLRFIDPDGRSAIERDKNGKIVFTPKDKIRIKHPSDNVNKNGVVVMKGQIYADDKTPITAFKNLSDDARYDTDCHGATFADGEYWINDSEVNAILKGDNYKEIASPGQGDVVVYFGFDGGVEHSATVISATEEVIVRGLGGLETEQTDQNVSAACSNGSEIKYFVKKEKAAKAK